MERKDSAPNSRGLTSSDWPEAGAFELHVFRVEEGLGNACALRMPDGSWGVVDWGTESDEPLSTLLDLVGPEGFRFIGASHAHEDHTLGLPKLLELCVSRELPVDWLFYPATTLPKPDSPLTRARVYAKKHKIRDTVVGVRIRPPAAPEPDLIAYEEEGDWAVVILAPDDAAVAAQEVAALERDEVAGNATSLVILAYFAETAVPPGLGRLVLPGDATRFTLGSARRMANYHSQLVLHNQAFLVPHHGSKANLPDWLGQYLHGVALVSGRTNSDHHPADSVLEQLRHESLEIFCTSYARCCRQRYGDRAGAGQSHLVRPGPCFGDFVVRVPRSGKATLARSSDDGGSRRTFGICGAPVMRLR